MVEDKILYTFRGWLAFVAFMDLGVTFRSFFENKCIMGTQSNLQADENFIHGTNAYVVNDNFIVKFISTDL
jgi:hypothetical protein